jgi:hypothetical protein
LLIFSLCVPSACPASLTSENRAASTTKSLSTPNPVLDAHICLCYLSLTVESSDAGEGGITQPTDSKITHLPTATVYQLASSARVAWTLEKLRD